MAVLFLLLVVLVTYPCSSTLITSTPASESCNDIYIQYTVTQNEELPPKQTNPALQPYKFESYARIVNYGENELKSWRLYVGFQNDEYLVSATNAIFEDGTPLPANTTSAVKVFAGFPMPDLKSAIQTAGDLEQMSVTIGFVGTEFGVQKPNTPMPRTISLLNDGYKCSQPSKQGNRTMYACCEKDPGFVTTVLKHEYQPRKKGDLVIFYDILRSFDSKYDAQVSVENQNPLGRLDNWKLSWTWMADEFVSSMRGAYPSELGSRDCVFGPQGRYYKDMNFGNVLSCQRNPTFLDLPPEKAYDSSIGMLPFCCKNGTLLPASMDPSRWKSIFQLQVWKMPPYINRTLFIPPQFFEISGKFSPDYKCGPAAYVTPSTLLDSSGSPTNETAVASWQVVCNIAPPEETIPKCCVSFSAFYNESVIPCPTCACGCDRYPTRTCNATAPANLLPLDALPIPFANRTNKAIAWASKKHLHYTQPEPCPDFCGVSIHWHVKSNDAKGWSARITLFNWGEIDFADWFAAMQFRKAVPGFEAMYSFNGTALNGSLNTIFMQGLEGADYIDGEVDGAGDPRVPGRLESIISFTKEKTPGIDIVAGDKFPAKVFFNGGECTLPAQLPSKAPKISQMTRTWAFVLGFVAFIFAR